MSSSPSETIRAQFIKIKLGTLNGMATAMDELGTSFKGSFPKTLHRNYFDQPYALRVGEVSITLPAPVEYCSIKDGMVNLGLLKKEKMSVPADALEQALDKRIVADTALYSALHAVTLDNRTPFPARRVQAIRTTLDSMLKKVEGHSFTKKVHPRLQSAGGKLVAWQLSAIPDRLDFWTKDERLGDLAQAAAKLTDEIMATIAQSSPQR